MATLIFGERMSRELMAGNIEGAGVGPGVKTAGAAELMNTCFCK
jgi:hypothetical protein